ncbi:hypothetical protein LshimejAT787_0410130 [Lyophyllum shimeji]|uniref:Uncharacterized protein n=1 Tax=Lyophyllum shimeji TaxID=47721 RepID=A0A9P3UM39_LYOSH|nr:hypothetical protein LshimejAT787_0410130 [Lyophyllum shimeji]
MLRNILTGFVKEPYVAFYASEQGKEDELQQFKLNLEKYRRNCVAVFVYPIFPVRLEGTDSSISMALGELSRPQGRLSILGQIRQPRPHHEDGRIMNECTS